MGILYFKVVSENHPVFLMLVPGLRTTELSKIAEELRDLAEDNPYALRAL